MGRLGWFPFRTVYWVIVYGKTRMVSIYNSLLGDSVWEDLGGFPLEQFIG